MKHADNGFTLMEVVVAMAILSVSAVLLLESHYASLDLTADAQAHAMQTQLIEAAINFAQIQVMSGENRGDGDFGEWHPGFRYAFTADEVEDDDRSGLYRVELQFEAPAESLQRTFYVYADALANDEKPRKNN